MPGIERQTNMKRHSSRILPAALAASSFWLPAAATSTAPPPPTSTVATVADDGVLSPRPIEIASGGAGAVGGNGSPAAASAEAADSRMSDMTMPYRITNFVVAEGLPALPTNDVGYVFQIGAAVSVEQVAALAASLGVTGDPVRIDEGYGVSWRVGPEDGTAPSVWVYEDAQLSWNYNSAWAEQPGFAGCAVAGPAVEPLPVDEAAAEPAPDDGSATEPTELPVLVDECVEPTPPANVPTADEAQARTRELMAQLGLDPAAFTFEPYADEWFASVSAVEQLDGLFAGRGSTPASVPTASCSTPAGSSPSRQSVPTP